MRGLRRYLALLLLLVISPARAGCEAWPAWEAFKSGWMSPDGRVIDTSQADQRTVSEAQAYAMMFALIANDRASFDRLLGWTNDNLARGDLAQHLPAWIWGKLPGDRGWGVIDPNAASDADVWMAYALLEAGRLWAEPRHAELGAKLLANIRRREVAPVPGLGEVLLPAPLGFVEHEPNGRRWRLNPSYLALQPLRRFRAHSGDAVWDAVLASSRRILVEGAARGLPGDWLLWRPETGFSPDEKTLGTGSYDAIRVYLWAGMLAPEDPDRAVLLAHLAPVSALLSENGRPPELWDVASGRTRGDGPGGYSAALLPFFAARGELSALLMQKLQLAGQTGADAQRYYMQALRLWGLGWDEGRYRFAADGSLQPRWADESCAPP